MLVSEDDWKTRCCAMVGEPDAAHATAMLVMRRRKSSLLIAVLISLVLVAFNELSLSSFSVSKRFVQQRSGQVDPTGAAGKGEEQVQQQAEEDEREEEERTKMLIYSRARSDQQAEEEEERTKVLIYSRARSGSSFLGSLFDRSPHVLYFFEPLWRQWTLLNRTIAEVHETVPSELSMLFNCNLSESWADDLRREEVKTFLKGRGRFFRQVFRELKAKDGTTSEQLRQRVNGLCEKRSHVVAKCIDRLPSLRLVEPIWDDRFFVLFLVRDPRAVLMSRVGLQLGASFNVSLDFLCGSALQDIDLLRETSSAPMKSNFLVVRYEDLVDDPLRMIRILFRFVHLPLHWDVVTWVHSLSRTRTTKGRFSVKQDPFNVAEKWRFTMNASMLDTVQRNPLCRSYMDLFGYNPLSFAALSDHRVHSHQAWYNGDEYAGFVRNIIIKV